MSTKNFYDKYKSTINVVVGISAVGIGYALYKSNQKKKELADAFRAKAAIEQELADLVAQGINPSYSDSVYVSMADGLAEAMTGCGTDETAVLNIFRQIVNAADIRKLLLAFGVRFYRPCVWTSPFSYIVSQFNDQAYGGDLSTWLYYDLSAGYIEDINSIMTANGVDYQL